jgi:hypothetical protein
VRRTGSPADSPVADRSRPVVRRVVRSPVVRPRVVRNPIVRPAVRSPAVRPAVVRNQIVRDRRSRPVAAAVRSPAVRQVVRSQAVRQVVRRSHLVVAALRRNRPAVVRRNRPAAAAVRSPAVRQVVRSPVVRPAVVRRSRHPVAVRVVRSHPVVRLAVGRSHPVVRPALRQSHPAVRQVDRNLVAVAVGIRLGHPAAHSLRPSVHLDVLVDLQPVEDHPQADERRLESAVPRNRTSSSPVVVRPPEDLRPAWAASAVRTCRMQEHSSALPRRNTGTAWLESPLGIPLSFPVRTVTRTSK